MTLNEYIDTFYYIYTECVNCPEICVNAIISYFKYHQYPIHIYLTQSDKEYFDKHIKDDRIRFILINDSLINIYNSSGHLGTAYIWTNVIKMKYGKKIIHFDSDVIFRGDIINDIVLSLSENDLVGPYRCYKNNLNNRDDIRNLPDVVSTYCFGFDSNKISINDFSEDIFVNMVRGFANPLGFNVLDFFDPVSFNIILKNNGKIKFIDFNIIGGMNEFGDKNNKYPLLNNKMDCGDKIIHFSSVGSGINFRKAIQKNKPIHTPKSYVDHSFKTLDIYNYLLFNKESSTLTLDIKDIKPIFNELINFKFIDFN